MGVQYTSGPPESLAECIRKIAEDVDSCAGMGRRVKNLFDAEYHSGKIYAGLPIILSWSHRRP